MKPKKFINQLNQNFTEILSVGFIVDSELKEFKNRSTIDMEDIEGLVMRLYFLSLDPEKKVKFFINQYSENKFLYLIKITEEVSLFVLCEDSNFAKLHFFIKYLLSDVNLEFETEEEEKTPISQDEEKLWSAKRIQNLLLPDMTPVLAGFSQKHLQYQPKDIVGGDFYWARKTKNHLWMVIGDSTGHSVEGALGSVSIMSILNQVFAPEMNPHHLIKALHDGLNNIQSQDLVDGYGIGCEMMVMKYEPKTKTLKYSSNGLLMYLIDDRVQVYKTKKSSFDQERVIKFIRSRTLHLNNHTAIFTHSDGLIDQIGENGKKLKRAPVVRALKEGKTGAEIETLFEQWKGSQIQTDDVVSLYLKP